MYKYSKNDLKELKSISNINEKTLDILNSNTDIFNSEAVKLLIDFLISMSYMYIENPLSKKVGNMTYKGMVLNKWFYKTVRRFFVKNNIFFKFKFIVDENNNYLDFSLVEKESVLNDFIKKEIKNISEKIERVNENQVKDKIVIEKENNVKDVKKINKKPVNTKSNVKTKRKIKKVTALKGDEKLEFNSSKEAGSYFNSNYKAVQKAISRKGRNKQGYKLYYND